MGIFIEVISTLWQAFWEIVSAFGTAIWNNLPQILELKKILGLLTPSGTIAIMLGVPIVLIPIFRFALKKVIDIK